MQQVCDPSKTKVNTMHRSDSGFKFIRALTSAQQPLKLKSLLNFKKGENQSYESHFNIK